VGLISDNGIDMKASRRASLIAVMMVFLMAPHVSAEAVPLSDRQIQVIKANCLNAQNLMQQLQRTEAVTRVNRGRAYESVSRLFVALNSRIALNKLSSPGLTAITAEMDKRFSSFKQNYSQYEETLAATAKLQCSDQPVTFYDSLTNARELRAKVAADIKSINESMDAYQRGVDELRSNISDGDTQ
jgi:hypothetical protein